MEAFHIKFDSILNSTLTTLLTRYFLSYFDEHRVYFVNLEDISRFSGSSSSLILIWKVFTLWISISHNPVKSFNENRVTAWKTNNIETYKIIGVELSEAKSIVFESLPSYSKIYLPQNQSEHFPKQTTTKYPNSQFQPLYLCFYSSNSKILETPAQL